MSDKKIQDKKNKEQFIIKQLSLLTQENNPNQYLDNLDRVLRSKKIGKGLRRTK